jgi:methyl-accepting chemotaxis protein
MKGFEGLRIGRRLLVSMLAVSVITLAVGIVSIVVIRALHQDNLSLHQKSFTPMAQIADMYDALGEQRTAASNIVLYFDIDDEVIQREAESIREEHGFFSGALENYSKTSMEDDEAALFSKIRQCYTSQFVPRMQTVIDLRHSSDAGQKQIVLRDIDALGKELSGYLDELDTFNTDQAASLLRRGQSIGQTSILLLAAIVIAAFIVSLLLSLRLAQGMQRPIADIERIMRYVRDTGDFSLTEELKKPVDELMSRPDELGSLAASYQGMMQDVYEKVLLLERVAGGDLSKTAKLAGPRDILGNAVNDVVTNLSAIVREVSDTTMQLTGGAEELSSGAQSLSQSSSEQSAAVDELHANAGEIAAEAEENAARAVKASWLAANIRVNAHDGANQMARMAQAMKDISDASHAASGVMRVIDDITFQTNLLALNAAVEAARAGAHGRGFAVVADEVRNLATRSSAAARETNDFIENTIAKAELGNRLVADALAFFNTIAEGVDTTSTLLDGIAEAARKQSDAIEAINNSVSELTDVVCHNSATSQESAAASEEMNNQAIMLKEMVSRFKLRHTELPSPAAARAAAEIYAKALGAAQPRVVGSSELSGSLADSARTAGREPEQTPPAWTAKPLADSNFTDDESKYCPVDSF